MASPVKIEKLTRALVVTYTGAASSVPGAVPGHTTEVEVPIGEIVPLNAAVACGYIGTTPAARFANGVLSAYVKHSDPTVLVFKWTQITGAPAAVPAGEYKFSIAW